MSNRLSGNPVLTHFLLLFSTFSCVHYPVAEYPSSDIPYLSHRIYPAPVYDKEADGFYVCKTPLTDKGDAHLKQMEVSCHKLKEQYESVFAIAPCTYENGKLVFPFVKGISLGAKMEAALKQNDLETIFDLFHTLLRKLRAGKTMAFANYDFVFGKVF